MVVAANGGARVWESCRQNPWVPILLPPGLRVQADVEGREGSERRGRRAKRESSSSGLA